MDLVRSEAAPYIAKEPQLLSLAKEALASTRLIHDTAVIECDMGRLVGYDFIVTPSNDEPVFYACILHDKVYTRFVKKGKPSSTKHITMTVRRSAKGAAYELCSVRIGRFVPPRPGSRDEQPRSREYWKTHAVVLGGQTLQPRTITKTCPY